MSRLISVKILRKLAQQLDPTHKFRNKFMEQYVFANVSSTTTSG
jgi:hypothetical protein